MTMTKPKTKTTPSAEASHKAKAKPPKPQRPIVEAMPSSCPKCRSTDRTAYSNTTEYPIAGMTIDGRQYSHVIWRTTACKSCGQVRRDRSYEMRSAPRGRKS